MLLNKRQILLSVILASIAIYIPMLIIGVLPSFSSSPAGSPAADRGEQILTNTTQFIRVLPNDPNITFDKDGIPYVNYDKIDGILVGQQRNPLTTCHAASEYLDHYGETGDESSKQAFFNNVNWLIENMETRGNYSVLQYQFPFPRYNMEPPWRSAMAQAEAMNVLLNAHDITKDKQYLDSAKMLFNALFVEVKDGGVTYKSPDGGWWYEEYADDGAKESRVLNGMMYTLVNINTYYDYTKDPNAKYLFDQGIVALKNNLSKYDNNGASYYDIDRLPATEQYHNDHIRLLDVLYKLTNEQVFKVYHDKWNS
jgi:heparosan-N-sulfate-glucuronate 5-epimerase